jgi:hypothetical protein
VSEMCKNWGWTSSHPVQKNAMSQSKSELIASAMAEKKRSEEDAKQRKRVRRDVYRTGTDAAEYAAKSLGIDSNHPLVAGISSIAHTHATNIKTIVCRNVTTEHNGRTAWVSVLKDALYNQSGLDQASRDILDKAVSDLNSKPPRKPNGSGVPRDAGDGPLCSDTEDEEREDDVIRTTKIPRAVEDRMDKMSRKRKLRTIACLMDAANDLIRSMIPKGQ